MKPRIGIELNGVLRDTLTKIEQTYKKFYVEDPLNITELKKYEVFDLLKMTFPYIHQLIKKVLVLNFQKII
jgi:hypothetical protein